MKTERKGKAGERAREQGRHSPPESTLTSTKTRRRRS